MLFITFLENVNSNLLLIDDFNNTINHISSIFVKEVLLYACYFIFASFDCKIASALLLCHIVGFIKCFDLEGIII